MQSGYLGAKNVTCNDCRDLLDWDDKKETFLNKLEKLVQKARSDDELTKKLMFAITQMPKN